MILEILENLSADYKKKIKVLLDIFLIFAGIYIGDCIVNEKISIYSYSLLFVSILTAFLIIPIFFYLNIYSEFIRYLDGKYLLKIFFGTILAFLILYLISKTGFEKSIFRYLDLTNLVSYFLIILIFFTNLRIIIKIIFTTIPNTKYFNCAIYGAGLTGVNIYNILKYDKKLRTVLFFDDDKNKIGRRIKGLEIFSINNFDQLNKKHYFHTIFICMPSTSTQKKEKVKKFFKEKNIIIKSIDTNYSKDMGERKNLDLIQKNNAKFKDDIFITLKQKLENKTIIVSGAGGSIGKEICFQLIKFNIKKLIVIEKNEFSIFQLKKELEEVKSNNLEIKFILSDMLRLKTLEEIVINNNPDYIFHAAAYKHVDIVENNPIEASYNNIKSLLNIIRATKNITKCKLTFISTDKAVRPINYMGKSKRIGELIVNSSGNVFKQNFYSTVRFGNVFGSSGSLIPIINEQIYKGLPISITHKNAKRYFMTIQDAINLTLSTINFSQNGEIYVLEMGPQINISNLIFKIINNNDLTIRNKNNPNGDIEIIYTGLKKGEKIEEELSYSRNLTKTTNDQIYKEKEFSILEENFIENIDKELEEIVKNNSLEKLDKFYQKYLLN